MIERCRVLAGMVVLLAATTAARAAVNEDVRTLYDRRLEQIRGTPAVVDSQDIAAVLTKLQPDGSFADLNYASTLLNDAWQPKLHLERMTALDAASLSPGKYHNDLRLKAAALKALGWWLAHDYRSENWFWNEIGVPSRLTPTLLTFWSDIPSADRTKALLILERAKINTTGTNLVWLAQIIADRGLLTGDPSLIRQAFKAIADDIHVPPTQKDGPQVDGSFLYHGALLYTWGYGSYYLHDQARLMAFVSGTGFAFPPEKVTLIRDWTLDGAQWLAHRSAADFGAEGREIARKHQDAKILNDIGLSLLQLKAGREADIQAMLARTHDDPAATPLVGNRALWRADMMVHHRPGWYASARLYSARTRNTEWGNGESLQSFYLADGAMVLLRSGKEYQDIYPVWDWQHVPGTTVEKLPNFGPIAGKPDGDAAGFVPNRDGISRPTKETFVGGVSDGQFGAFGGRFSRDTLAWQRGWFFFDNQIICLGAGLKCDTTNAVVTTLEQCRSAGPVQVDSADPAHPRWLLHDGAGYVALDAKTTFNFTCGPQTGSWHDISVAYPPDRLQEPVFKAWIDHGQQPHDATFAYAVCPQADAAHLQAFADPAHSVARVASNTPNCQAVWQTEENRGAAILYVPGSVDLTPGLTVTANQACMLLLSVDRNRATVSLANPENRPAVIHVIVKMKNRSAAIDMSLPAGDRAGSTVQATIDFSKLSN